MSSCLKWLLPILFFSFTAVAQQQNINISFANFNFTADSSLSSLDAKTNSFPGLSMLVHQKTKGKNILGYTNAEKAVEIYFFPGKTKETALIIGGMHGSELSSIELAENIVHKLSGDVVPEYNVLIIPRLFPDNADCAATSLERKGKSGAGRYSSLHSVDPNRQMPGLGKPFLSNQPFDAHGRMIETENQYLLRVIQEYKPARIANLHAIRNVQRAGIFADPRTDADGLALGFEADSLLAFQMASFICEGGGLAGGNFSNIASTFIYYKDPAAVPAGHFQPRNLAGSDLEGNRGAGISLGSWATTAVNGTVFPRPAITLITVEFPGYSSSDFIKQEKERFNYLMNLELYTGAVMKYFLQ